MGFEQDVVKCTGIRARMQLVRKMPDTGLFLITATYQMYPYSYRLEKEAKPCVWVLTEAHFSHVASRWQSRTK